jgi:hypothetical protein
MQKRFNGIQGVGGLIFPGLSFIPWLLSLSFAS